MENRKKLVKGIIKFLLDEMESSDLDAERKESLEVAVQCLETCYDLDGQRSAPCEVDLVKLVEQKGGPTRKVGTRLVFVVCFCESEFVVAGY